MTRRIPGLLLIALAAICTVPAGAGAVGTVTPGYPEHMTAVIPLIVDETNHVFTLSKQPLKVKPGVIKVVTLVPASAKSYHGVGIDGGPYSDVKGAWVLPGRASSLTVQVERGRYTLFDSYKDNRKLGYRASLSVSKSAKQVRRAGRSCGRFAEGFSGHLDNVHVKRTSCKQASRVGDSAFELWESGNFEATVVTTRGFKCRIRTNSPIGLQVICRSGSRRVHFSA